MALRNVLLAEDDADDRELFLEAMSVVAPDIKVATVENGEKLIKLLTESHLSPDCIFLDLNMPRKNGRVCLIELKNNAKTRNIPIVIYSTSISKKDVDETFHRGATCFIRKPNSFRELTLLLNKYITSISVRSDAPLVKHDFILNS